jgi:hypothetical protein
MSEVVESVDSILAEALTPEIPMTAPSESESQPQPEANTETQVKPEGDGRTIIYKGEEVSIDDNKYKMLAQKGYSYEQDRHQLKVDRKLWERERDKEMGSLEELRQINEYAKTNPQFQALIQREWANIQGGGQIQQDSTQQQQMGHNPQIDAILQRLNAQDEDLRIRGEAEKEAKLESAIETYKETYGSFDWETKDDLGQTLEDRITQHAVDSQIRDFKTAANDYLFDEHLKRASLESKEKAAKTIQKQNKLGLGKVTDQSTLDVKRADGVRSKSYNDLAAEALREFGLG